MTDKKENPLGTGSIPSDPDEKSRFIEALRKLQQEGVRIIDDEPGRTRIIPALASERDNSRQSESPLFNDLESVFGLEDQVGSDPYNKF